MSWLPRLLWIGAAALTGCDSLLGVQDHSLIPSDTSAEQEGGGTSSSGGSSGSDAGFDATDGPGGDSDGVCVIAGTTYESGAADPGNSCQTCQPTVSTSAWSDAADGEACGSGETCKRGTCIAGCEIGAMYYAANAVNPSDACQSCQPGTSTTGWTNLGAGASCGAGCTCSASTTTVTFDYTGAQQSFIVPTGVTQVTITAAGAAGGTDCYDNAGGYGASVTATLAVSSGQTLAVLVGSAGGPPGSSGGYCSIPGAAGYNGGAAGGATTSNTGAGGGGASDVRVGGTGLSNRIIVASGGGGGGTGGAGGTGGTTSGGPGTTGTGGGGAGGGGGSQGAGGAGGAGAATTGTGPGAAGGEGAGGTGGMGTCNVDCGEGGGGGGGGYYGGGGGGGGTGVAASGGGGGGSSYAEPSATGVSMQAGVQMGDGQVVITFQ
ncbi:MAG TPA: hypothetical protein VGL81_11200 [Polyangiaceae bacterium]